MTKRINRNPFEEFRVIPKQHSPAIYLPELLEAIESQTILYHSKRSSKPLEWYATYPFSGQDLQNESLLALCSFEVLKNLAKETPPPVATFSPGRTRKKRLLLG